MAREEEILGKAEFDRRLPRYFMLQAVVPMLFSIVLIPLIPIWILFGMPIHRKQYKSLECVLTARSLKVKRGFLLKVQKSIPLDKITDLAVSEGPILRYLGLCSLAIETAGGGHGSSMGQAILPGVANAEAFRDLVLDRRDAVTTGDTPAAAPAGAAVAPAQDAAVLGEIRDTLGRIETYLRERDGR